MLIDPRITIVPYQMGVGEIGFTYEYLADDGSNHLLFIFVDDAQIHKVLLNYLIFVGHCMPLVVSEALQDRTMN